MTEEPDAGKPHVRICMGGSKKLGFLPLQMLCQIDIKLKYGFRVLDDFSSRNRT